MPRSTEDPVTITGKGPLEGTETTHPAFGQIAASRVQGGIVLYGSDFVHHNFVTIAIRRSQLQRDLSRDWHFPREELIEVALSEAQWATFVSSMNTGSGVPCTLQHVGRETCPAIPLRKATTVAKQELSEKLESLTKDMQQAIADVEGIIGSTLSKTKREAVLERMRKAERTLRDSLPFATKQLEKHLENSVEAAKVEVNAYIGNVIQRAGLEALGAQPPLQLESGDES